MLILSSFHTYKIAIIFAITGFSLILISLIAMSRTYSPKQEEVYINTYNENPIEDLANSEYVVDVQGAVKKPGIYVFENKVRIAEVIERVDGFQEQADTHWIGKSLNQALYISDGMKLYIPFENDQLSSSAELVDRIDNRLINLNLSSKEELKSLPGVGEVTAQKIINARPITSVSSLLEEGLVGEKTFEKIESSVIVD